MDNFKKFCKQIKQAPNRGVEENAECSAIKFDDDDGLKFGEGITKDDVTMRASMPPVMVSSPARAMLLLPKKQMALFISALTTPQMW
jgi:hypothetical protein